MSRGPWKHGTLSRYAVAGEPVAQFLRREAGYRGCWLCSSRSDADGLRSSLFAASNRLGIKISTEMIPAGDMNGNGYLVLVATIKRKTKETTQ